MPDTSIPSPSDPDSPGRRNPSIPKSGNLPAQKEKPRLKLKRLIVKDIEINPHVNPDAEPTPHAEAISESEPPPPDIELQKVEVQPLKPVQPPLEEIPEKIPEENQEEKPEEHAEAKAPEKPEIIKERSRPVEPRKKRRKLIPLLLVVGSLLCGVYIIFDPLGFKPDPIVPVDIPLQVSIEEPVEEIPEPPESKLEISSIPVEGSEPDIQDYLTRISQQQLSISQNPKGIFINSIFYSEGMSLNPALGLIVLNISDESEKRLLIIADREGQLYPITIP